MRQRRATARQRTKVRPFRHVDRRVVPPLAEVLEAELDGAPAVECVLGAATWRLDGRWLGVPVAGLEDLAAVVFEVTGQLVPVTHPQPFHADVALARGRVAKELAGLPVSARWTARSVSLVVDLAARPTAECPRSHGISPRPSGVPTST